MWRRYCCGHLLVVDYPWKWHDDEQRATERRLENVHADNYGEDGQHETRAVERKLQYVVLN